MIQRIMDENAEHQPPETEQRLPAVPPPPPALSRRAQRIVVVRRDARDTRIWVLAWDHDRLHVLGHAQGENGADLGRDLSEACARLSRVLPHGERVPKEGILLSADVTAAVVDLPAPALKLPGWRLEGLVGWELDAFFPGADLGVPRPASADGGTHATIASGWAGPLAAGPILAAGMRPEQRDEAASAFSRAGLRLRGIYPLHGCAAAAIPPGLAGPAQVLEVATGVVSVTRVALGRVLRHRVMRVPPGGEAPTCRELVPEDATLLIASPVPDEVRTFLDGLAWSELAPEEAPGVPAAIAGAAWHALELPGAERIAAVPAQARRRPLLQLPIARWIVGFAFLLAAVVGLDTLQTSAIAAATLRKAELQAEVRPEAATLEKELAQARADLALQNELRGRREALPGLLRAVAEAATEDMILRVLREEPDGTVFLEGLAATDLSVRRFARDLALGLEPLGLVPQPPEVKQATTPGDVGYQFQLRCQPKARTP